MSKPSPSIAWSSICWQMDMIECRVSSLSNDLAVNRENCITINNNSVGSGRSPRICTASAHTRSFDYEQQHQGRRVVTPWATARLLNSLRTIRVQCIVQGFRKRGKQSARNVQFGFSERVPYIQSRSKGLVQLHLAGPANALFSVRKADL